MKLLQGYFLSSESDDQTKVTSENIFWYFVILVDKSDLKNA